MLKGKKKRILLTSLSTLFVNDMIETIIKCGERLNDMAHGEFFRWTFENSFRCICSAEITIKCNYVVQNDC